MVLGAEFGLKPDVATTTLEVAPAELLAAAPDLLLHVDPQGRVCRVNRPDSPLAPEGLLGAMFLVLAAAEQHDAVRAALAGVLAGRADATVETSRVGADGVAWMSCHFAPVRRRDAVVGAVIGVRDVSAYKRTEAQLIVSDRMASIGMLTAGVAHEINNPLSSVLANLDLALREVARVAAELPISSELEEGLRDAREAAVRVKSIVRDIRTFSRAEDDRVAPVDVRRAIEAVLRLAQNEIRHRARVTTSFAALPPVLANESRLGQVFLNLLVNAAQAIPEGKADENEIRIVTSMSASGGLIIEVADTGCGMSPDVLKRLFTPFFTTKPAGVGTGLGLSICQRIVAGMGGRIDVTSEAGRGSSIRVWLPAGVAERSAPTVTKPPPVSVASRRGRVLVIDDERLVGSAIRRTLAAEHDVATVESARAALERLASGERFDVIFCDLMMPEMTGMDLHRELREAHPDQAARVIFLTGGAFTPRARAFLERVPNPRIEKPFDLEQVRALVNERLR
jgi:PAS domain S-box-containing protein